MRGLGDTSTLRPPRSPEAAAAAAAGNEMKGQEIASNPFLSEAGWDELSDAPSCPLMRRSAGERAAGEGRVPAETAQMCVSGFRSQPTRPSISSNL